LIGIICILLHRPKKITLVVFLVCMWNAMIENIIKINHENKCSQRYFELGAYWCRDD